MRVPAENRPTHPAQRHLRWVAVLSLLMITVGACGSGDDGAETDESTTTIEAQTSTTIGEAESSTTSAPDAPADPGDVAAYPTQKAASERLYALWGANDRWSADNEKIALAAELDKMFAIPAGPEAKYRGCDVGEFGSSSCLFGNGQGGVTVTLAQSEDGWRILYIDAFGG